MTIEQFPLKNVRLCARSNGLRNSAGGFATPFPAMSGARTVNGLEYRSILANVPCGRGDLGGSASTRELAHIVIQRAIDGLTQSSGWRRRWCWTMSAVTIFPAPGAMPSPPTKPAISSERMAEEICRDDDIELPGVKNQLHRARIDNAVLGLHAVLIGFRDLARSPERRP